LNVAVTGAAGYIGSVLCERLLQAGHRVHAVDNLSHGTAGLFHLAANEQFEFTRGDVRDERLMREVVAKADVLIPLAALVGAPACERDPEYA
jgi:nucleoside-diphosphate-sugar epimerase